MNRELEVQRVLEARHQEIKGIINRLSEGQLDDLRADAHNMAARHTIVPPTLDEYNDESSIIRGQLEPGFSIPSRGLQVGILLERKDIRMPIKGDFRIFQPLWLQLNHPNYQWPQLQYNPTSIEIKEYIFPSEGEESTNNWIRLRVESVKELLSFLHEKVTGYNAGLQAFIEQAIDQRKTEFQQARQQQEDDSQKARNWRNQ